ncbi:MAG: MalY/PatB family protein [Gammaproteobacteria bacterium]|nr:MalY/PatB family protein [Gammaproteobacteria bacterium]
MTPFDRLDRERLRGLSGKKWSNFAGDVLPAWVADMDFPIADPIRRYLERMVATSDFGYPEEAEAERLCRAFAERSARRFGWQVEPARIELMADVVQGILLCLQQFTRSGDGVVIDTPIYPPFLSSVESMGRRVVRNPMRTGNDGYLLDVAHLADIVDDATRMYLLCNPHNPTGRVLTRAELEAVAEQAVRHDFVVVADEIHADLLYDGRRHVPFASLAPEVAARTITLTSATKSFNTAGLRLSIAVFGSEQLQERFNAVPSRLRGGLNCFGAAVTRIAWEEGDDWLAGLVDYLHGNRDLITRFVTERMPQVRYFAPQATFLAWLDCRALDLEPDPCTYFLEHARVALSDGRTFGEEGEGCVRLNFATPRAQLEEILERMARSID